MNPAISAVDSPECTRVYLLRHAESALPTVFHGAESDIPLGERGRRQALAAAKVLAPLRPTALISSNMLRARETAEPIAQACGLEMRIEPDLHERRVGRLSGVPFDAMDDRWNETLRRWVAGETSYSPPDAESFDEILARVLPIWNRLANAHAGSSYVIVAHGVICKVLLLSLVQGLHVSQWKTLGPIRNVGINELVFEDNTWKSIRLNDWPGPLAEI